jgi:hypothetical protein
MTASPGTSQRAKRCLQFTFDLPACVVMLNHTLLIQAICAALFALTLFRCGAAEVVFRDEFKGQLGEGWSWVREDRTGWRVTAAGLVWIGVGRAELVRRLGALAEGGGHRGWGWSDELRRPLHSG